MTRRTYEQSEHLRSFGNRVRTLRTDRGWTQELLAERAGLDRSYLANIEAGGNPTLDVIYRLAQALEVTLPEIVTF